MRKCEVTLTFLLGASGCGGSSDTATPAVTVVPAETQAPTTTVAATTTAAPTTTTPPTTTLVVKGEHDETSNLSSSEGSWYLISNARDQQTFESAPSSTLKVVQALPKIKIHPPVMNSCIKKHLASRYIAETLVERYSMKLCRKRGSGATETSCFIM